MRPKPNLFLVDFNHETCSAHSRRHWIANDAIIMFIPPKMGENRFFITTVAMDPLFVGGAHPHQWMRPKPNLFPVDFNHETCSAHIRRHWLANDAIRMFVAPKMGENRFFIITMAMDPLFMERDTHMSR